MKTTAHDYLKGLEAGFQESQNSKPDSNQSIYYRLGFCEGQKAYSEYQSTQMVVDSFLNGFGS